MSDTEKHKFRIGDSNHFAVHVVHVQQIEKDRDDLRAEVSDLRGQLAVCEEHARTSERDMQASIHGLRLQLDRICKEGFAYQDTIGGEPADDYVLRQLAKLLSDPLLDVTLSKERDALRAEVERLKADKARLDWIEKHVTSLPMLSEAWGELPWTFRDVLDGAMNPNPETICVNPRNLRTKPTIQ